MRKSITFRRRALVALVPLCVIAVSGCGGGGGSRSGPVSTGTGSAAPLTRQTGTISFKVAWPASSAGVTRVIPANTQSLVATLKADGITTVATETKQREADSTVTVKFDGSKFVVGAYTITVDALDGPNGTGKRLATATVPLTLQAGVNNVDVVLSESLSNVALLSGTTDASNKLQSKTVGDTVTLTAQVQDVAGNPVAAPTGTYKWEIENNGGGRIAFDDPQPGATTTSVTVRAIKSTRANKSEDSPAPQVRLTYTEGAITRTVVASFQVAPILTLANPQTTPLDQGATPVVLTATLTGANTNAADFTVIGPDGKDVTAKVLGTATSNQNQYLVPFTPLLQKNASGFKVAGQYTITATPTDGSGVPQTTTLTVNAVSITDLVSDKAVLNQGDTATFTATLIGVADAYKTVRFTKVERSGNDVTNLDGVLTGTAPLSRLFTALVRKDVGSDVDGTYRVTVTADADPSVSLTRDLVQVRDVSVSVKDGGTTVSGTTVQMFALSSKTFTAPVAGTNAANTGVTWKLTSSDGSSHGASVSGTGQVTMGTWSGTYTLTAISVADSRRSASVTIEVPSGNVAGTIK